MIRATTSGTIKSYRYHLNQSRLTLDSSMNTALTQRNFNSYAEDPSAAAESFQLRRAFSNISSQLTVSETTSRKFDTAYGAVESVVNMVDNMKDSSAMTAIMSALNDATGTGRNALGTELIQLADSIVQSLNCQYGDQYLFSGADGLNIPFTWAGDTLCYRGIDVDTTDPDEVAKLEYMSKNENNFVDVGIGLAEDENGNLLHPSAFNTIMQGIDALGYGTNEEGISKNLASIVRQMGNILSRCDADSGQWHSSADQSNFQKLYDQFLDSASELKRFHVDMSTKANYLQNNQSVLEDTAYTINEQILAVEECDLADAITSFSWAQYCYNAALKMGNNVLGESLMDYLST